MCVYIYICICIVGADLAKNIIQAIGHMGGIR